MTNFTFKDAAGATKTARSETNGGVETPGLVLLDAAGAVLKGQEAKADSIPVTIAIDDDVLLALGYLNDAAVLDADGSINAHIRGAITILLDRLMKGQQTMANSLSVVLASNQTAVPVSGTITVNEPVSVDDNGGSLTVDDGGASLTVDSAQLPATLGQKTGTNSLSVVTASDDTSLVTLASILTALTTGPVPTREQRFSLKGRYTSSAVDVSGPNADIKTDTATPPTYAGAIAPAAAFFGATAITNAPRYVYIPLQGSGFAYDKVGLYVYSSLASGGGAAINAVVNLYAVEDSGTRELWSPLDTVTLNTDTKRGVKWSKGTGGSAVSSALLTGAGSPVYRALDALMGPVEYLVVEIIPASDPDVGEIEVVVIRERGSN